MTSDRLTWDDREQRLLETIADAEAAGVNRIDTADVAEALPELRRAQVELGLRNLLEAAYITGTDVTDADSEVCDLMEIRLIERGYRAVRQWPSEDAAATLLSIIDARIDATTDPEESSRLQRLRDALRSTGTATAQQLLVAFIRHMAGV